MDLEIDLWLWPIDLQGAARAGLEAHLSDDEARRAAAFVFERDRRRFVCARGRMREILAERMRSEPAQLRFDYGDRGKPLIADGPSFNLSHSGGWATLAISPGPAIGVDIEAFRTVEAGLADHVFSMHERSALAALPPSEREAGFFRCWTRKEAFLKASGQGLWQRLQSFDVTLDLASPPRVIRVHDDPTAGDAWRMASLDLGPQFVGAVAVKTCLPLRIIYRHHVPPLRPAAE